MQRSGKIAVIVKLLEGRYSRRPWRRWGKPLDGLIGTSPSLDRVSIRPASPHCLIASI
jgi:hypothetical protein